MEHCHAFLPVEAVPYCLLLLSAGAVHHVGLWQTYAHGERTLTEISADLGNASRSLHALSSVRLLYVVSRPGKGCNQSMGLLIIVYTLFVPCCVLGLEV